jgi:hypothetical protein
MPTLAPSHREAKLAFTLICAAALNLSLAASASSLPKRSKPVCNCMCDAGSGGIKDMTYTAVAACSVYDGKTCNYEDPNGIIKTGRLIGCGAGANEVNPAAAATASPSSAGVLDATTVPPKPKVPSPARPDAATMATPR